jgi:hypothetical protein
MIIIAKKSLKNTLSAESVTIEDCGWNMLESLEFTGISAEKEDIKIRIGLLGFRYTMGGLLVGRIDKIYVKNSKIEIGPGGPNKNYAGYFLPGPNINKRFPDIKTAEIEDFSGDINTDRVSARFNISASFDIDAREITGLDLYMSLFETDQVIFKDIEMAKADSQEKASVTIKEAEFGGLKVTGIKGAMDIKAGEFFVESLTAGIFGGTINANAGVYAKENIRSEVSADLNRANIQELVKALKIQEKIAMSGILSGSFEIAAVNGKIKSLKGNFSTVSPEGILTIKDEEFLKNIAERKKIPLKIIMEQFGRFYYNIGTARLFLENNQVVVKVNLEGKSGEADFTVVLHDFIR